MVKGIPDDYTGKKIHRWTKSQDNTIAINIIDVAIILSVLLLYSKRIVRA